MEIHVDLVQNLNKHAVAIGSALEFHTLGNNLILENHLKSEPSPTLIFSEIFFEIGQVNDVTKPCNVETLKIAGEEFFCHKRRTQLYSKA